MEKAIIRCISLWTCDASVILQICQLSFLFRDCENPLEMLDSSRKPTVFRDPPILRHTRFFGASISWFFINIPTKFPSLARESPFSWRIVRCSPTLANQIFRRSEGRVLLEEPSRVISSHGFAVKFSWQCGNAMTLSASCLQDFFRTAAMAQLVHLRISPLNSWCYSWILFMQMFVAPDIKKGKDLGRSWLFLPTFLVDGTSDDPNMGSFRLISGWRYWTLISLRIGSWRMLTLHSTWFPLQIVFQCRS